MTPTGFATLSAILRQASGLAIGPDRAYLLETRLAPLLRRHKLADLDALAARLRGGGAVAELARDVVEAMTNGETAFFRDDKPFTHVASVALPRLNTARPPGRKLRIWSAAASTGQEAYSLAMILAENRIALAGREVEIIATDIAREPLARARAGIYTQLEVQRGLPARLLVKYFRRESGGWRIAEPIRAMAAFREWNLLGDLRPLGTFDVVFCRNVLSSFDTATQSRVLQAIARQLAPDALLYLGQAETVPGLTGQFAPVAGDRGVYAPFAAQLAMAPAAAH